MATVLTLTILHCQHFSFYKYDNHISFKTSTTFGFLNHMSMDFWKTTVAANDEYACTKNQALFWSTLYQLSPSTTTREVWLLLSFYWWGNWGRVVQPWFEPSHLALEPMLFYPLSWNFFCDKVSYRVDRKEPVSRPQLWSIRGKNMDLNKDTWNHFKRQTQVSKLLTTNVAEGWGTSGTCIHC